MSNTSLLDLCLMLGGAASATSKRAAGTLLNVADSRQSLSEFSAGSRLSPPIMIEGVVARMSPEVTHSINQTLLQIYMGHYLAVANRLNKLGNVSVTALLDPLTDPRALNGFDFVNTKLASSLESLDAVLPTWNVNNLDLLSDYSLEALPDMSKPVNLAVGRMFEVPLMVGDKTFKFPITVALLPKALPVNELMRVIGAYLKKDNSFIGRYQRLMAGEFNNFWEYAFGLDLAKEDLSLKVNDEEDFYEAIQAKEKRGLLASFISGKKQMNIASAMFVISKETANTVEREMRGLLSRYRDRQGFFQKTGSMLLAVVDMDRELVRIYQRGIEEYGDYGYDDLSPAATNPNAFDVNAIMRAYNAGQQFTGR